MSLLPYALRPRVVLRSFVIRRGVVGGSPFWRPIAMLMVGQGEYIRARALRHGVILGSRYWRIVGATIILQDLHRTIVRRHPEHVTVERVRAGHQVKVTVSEPNLQLSRRERRRVLARMRADAEATVAASKRRS